MTLCVFVHSGVEYSGCALNINQMKVIPSQDRTTVHDIMRKHGEYNIETVLKEYG